MLSASGAGAMAQTPDADLRGLVLERIPAVELADDEILTSDFNGDGLVDSADLLALGTGDAVRFTASLSQWLEGTPDLVVPISFDAPFFGTVTYRLSGPPETSVAITGSLQLHGETIANIVLPITDDAEIGQALVYQVILDGAAGGYSLGGQAMHTAVVHDDDALWQGSFSADGLSVHFTLKLLRQGGVLSGYLVTDGYGIIPRAEDAAPGEPSEWPLTDTLLTDQRFTARIDGLPIPAFATQSGLPLTRALELDARAELDGESVDPNGLIVGAVTETLVAPGHSYLTRQVVARFTLQKAVSDVDLSDPVLEDALP